jgi:hypothetical protein
MDPATLGDRALVGLEHKEPDVDLLITVRWDGSHLGITGKGLPTAHENFVSHKKNTYGETCANVVVSILKNKNKKKTKKNKKKKKK